MCNSADIYACVRACIHGMYDMYVCMDGWPDGWMDKWMDGWMDVAGWEVGEVDYIFHLHNKGLLVEFQLA